MVTIGNHRSLVEGQRSARAQRSDAAYQAFAILRTAFTVAPIIFGLDKFTNVLVQWDHYLAPVLSRPLPVTPHQAMYAVGVIEVVAGLIVALHPRLGALVVAVWLGGIIVNLLLIPGFYDVALRDFGLLLAAAALQRLASRYDPRPTFWPLRRRD
ncbi:DoxX family membrane protein [Terrabacter terrae]|uniref:DoxX family membrane protein n=1 Tax=Terrabacter terrae TaxID=318434 RepID=A0ABN2UJC9_9MICO